MLRGKEDVEKWYDMNVADKYVNWRISHARNKQAAIMSYGADTDESEEGTTPASRTNRVDAVAAKVKLNETLVMLLPGDYYLAVNNCGRFGRGQREIQFNIAGVPAAVAGTGVQSHAGAGYYSEEQVEKRIKEAQETWETKQLLKRIQEQFEEYKKSSGNRGLDKLVDALSPHTKEIIQGLFPPAPGTTSVGVHGFEKAKATTADEQARLETALVKFNDARPDDFLELMELIAKTAKEKPEIVEMLKKMA